MKLIVVSLSHLFSILNSILLRFIYKLCIRSFIKLDTDSYSIHSTLTSSRKLEEDIVIEGASQESVSSKYHHSLVLAGDWTTILIMKILYVCRSVQNSAAKQKWLVLVSNTISKQVNADFLNLDSSKSLTSLPFAVSGWLSKTRNKMAPLSPNCPLFPQVKKKGIQHTHTIHVQNDKCLYLS